MGSGSAGGQGEEFIYLLEDLTPDQVQGLGMEELKAFLQEQLRNAYDLKEGQINKGRLMRGGLHPPADRHAGVNIFRRWMPYVNPWACVDMGRRIH